MAKVEILPKSADEPPFCKLTLTRGEAEVIFKAMGRVRGGGVDRKNLDQVYSALEPYIDNPRLNLWTGALDTGE